MASGSNATSPTLSPSARLSYSEFEIAIKAFLTQTQRHSPWTCVDYQARKGLPLRYYLTMTQLIHSHQKESRQPGSESGPQKFGMDDQLLLEDLTEHFGNISNADGSLGEEESDLSISAIDSTCIDFLSVSYHIVFSPSYQVPVLYFNAYYPDGSAITREEVYDSLVPEEWRSSIRNAGLNGGISQQDHPILNVPFFYMHPCETVSLMETVLSSQSLDETKSFLKTYIMTWLSFTGQAIGISVPTDIVYTRPATDAEEKTGHTNDESG